MGAIVAVTLILLSFYLQYKLTPKKETSKGPTLLVSIKDDESKYDNPSLILLEKKLCEMKSGQGNYIIFENANEFMQTYLDHSKDDKNYYQVEYKLDSMEDYLHKSKEKLPQNIMLELFRKFHAKDESYQNDIDWKRFDL